jgi:hypothetical protein
MIESFFTIDSASADASINGTPWEVRKIAGFSVQISHGEITGTLELEARNDESMPWSEVTDVTFTAPSGSAGDEIVEVGNARSRYYRLVYTSTSGTGALRACVHAKSD